MATPPFKYAIFQHQGPDRVNAYLLRNKSPTQRRTSLHDARPLVDRLATTLRSVTPQQGDRPRRQRDDRTCRRLCSGTA